MIHPIAIFSVATATLAACVPALPGGSLDEPAGGSAGTSGDGAGGAAGTMPVTGGGATGVAGGPATGGSAVTGAGGTAGGPAFEPLVMDGGRPGNIAVDSTNVYWVHTVARALMRAPIAGGPPTPLMPVIASSAWVAVDGENVYWSDGQLGNPPAPTTIFKMAAGGGTPTTLATGLEIINRFAVGRDGVYWTTSAGTVMKVGLAGGTPTVLSTGQGAPTEIVVDADSVYWVRTDDRSIMMLRIAGGGPVQLASSPSAVPSSLAVDATFAYWVEMGNGNVMWVRLGGGEPELAFTYLTATRSVAVDASRVYWTDSRSGDVFVGQPHSAIGPTAIASGSGPPAFGLVLDATNVYWIGGGLGSIYRAPR